MATRPPVRWVYGKSRLSAENDRRQEIERKIDDWWAEFQSTTGRIVNLFTKKENWDLPAWMNEHLGAIEPKLMWEFGPAVRGDGHRLVITPESARHLRPLTDAILAKAPRIDGWEFYSYRVPENFEKAEWTVKGRTGGDLSGVMASARIGEHNLIDLAYYSARAESAEDEQANKDAFVATESLLGEEWLDKWIGAIHVAPMPARREAGMVSLGMLPERVGALIGQVSDQVPEAPLHQHGERASWSLFELQPNAADDYPAQSDMFLGKSMHVPVWLAAHSGAVFCSERFSKHKETFCYVKVDGAEGLGKDGFADKSEIEDALDAVLKPAGLGCHVGGGTGLRYSYVDLALLDVTNGITAVMKRLREGNVPKRSWILFYDDYLAAEWVGIYEDSPRPPMPDFQ